MRGGSQLRAERALAKAVAAAEAQQRNLVRHRCERVERIQKLYYHILPPGLEARLPVPPSCFVQASRNQWEQDYQVWRNAVILLVLSTEPDPQQRPTISSAQAREHKRHVGMLSRQYGWDDNDVADSRIRIALAAAIPKAIEKKEELQDNVAKLLLPRRAHD